jgi:hypothetical protein
MPSENRIFIEYLVTGVGCEQKGLSLISHEMKSTYYTARNSPLIYCPVRLLSSGRAEEEAGADTAFCPKTSFTADVCS